MITPEDRQEMARLIGVNPINVEPPVIELIDRLIGVRRNEGEDAFRRKLSDLLRVPDRDVDHAKLATHLQETNDVLISRVRSLEIKLEKAEKALAVEREACAKVAVLQQLLQAVFFESEEAPHYVDQLLAEIERQGMDRVPLYKPLVDAMRAALSAFPREIEG